MLAERPSYTNSSPTDNIYIRPLCRDDALRSWRWRNDPEIWRFTGRRPDREITVQIETEWIAEVLSQPNSKRFAICIEETNEYIGNVQLTDISDEDAQFHIFIGERRWWGKGIATRATRLLLDYAREALGLSRVYLHVNASNLAAIRVYEKVGFKKDHGSDRMTCELASTKACLT